MLKFRPFFSSYVLTFSGECDILFHVRTWLLLASFNGRFRLSPWDVLFFITYIDNVNLLCYNSVILICEVKYV